MRATVNGIEVEGTPSEIAELLDAMGKSSGGDPAQPQSDTQPDGDEVEITEQFAYRTLKRIPLSSFQKSLLKSLRRAHPEWLLASEISRQHGWTGTQLGGVLGGLGRRLTATKGYQYGYELWNWKWDEDEGEYAYRLPEAVIAAFDRLD
ncbi:MAG: hypothetical protein CMN71_00970 [Sphingomonadaceae bacterium]|nr:hypothetical protein [Sphingomonadaceae bacterium]